LLSVEQRSINQVTTIFANHDLAAILACPGCLDTLIEASASLRCGTCARTYPVQDGVPRFCAVPTDVSSDLAHSVLEAQNRQGWSAWRRKNYNFLAREMAIIPKESLVIDVGAGPGFFTDILQGFRYCAIDFFNYPNTNVVCDVVNQRLPIGDGVADVVLLTNVLEHLSKPECLLEECRRILKVKSTLLITVPFMIKVHQAPYDFYRYTHFKLRQMLEAAGFRLVKIEKLGTIYDLLGSIKYEIANIAYAHARRRWLLKQFLRLDYHLTRVIRWLFLPSDEQELLKSDFFVGYAAIAEKSGQ
jgi:SAM-dependent methyltransferase